VQSERVHVLADASSRHGAKGGMGTSEFAKRSGPKWDASASSGAAEPAAAAYRPGFRRPAGLASAKFRAVLPVRKSIDSPQVRRLLGERDALRELVALVTHDLSNPVQSLTVLCELMCEEMAPHSEPYRRAQQCLQATSRMRDLIRDLAWVTQLDGSHTLNTRLERAIRLLGRALERRQLAVDCSLGDVGNAVAPAGFEFVALALLHAIIGDIQPGQTRGVLRVRGLKGSANYPVGVELCGVTKVAQSEQAIPLVYVHLTRVTDLLAEADAKLEIDDNTARLWFKTTAVA
jgi:hypothetical protein